MMRTLTTILALVATPIMAQQGPPCGDRDVAIETLRDTYGERQQVVMLDHEGNLVEIFAAENGGWTLLLTRPGGPTCFITSGGSFNLVEEPFGEDM